MKPNTLSNITASETAVDTKTTNIIESTFNPQIETNISTTNTQVIIVITNPEQTNGTIITFTPTPEKKQKNNLDQLTQLIKSEDWKKLEKFGIPDWERLKQKLIQKSSEQEEQRINNPESPEQQIKELEESETQDSSEKIEQLITELIEKIFALDIPDLWGDLVATKYKDPEFRKKFSPYKVKLRAKKRAEEERIYKLEIKELTDVRDKIKRTIESLGTGSTVQVYGPKNARGRTEVHFHDAIKTIDQYITGNSKPKKFTDQITITKDLNPSPTENKPGEISSYQNTSSPKLPTKEQIQSHQTFTEND